MKHSERESRQEFTNRISGAPEYENLMPYEETGEHKWVIRKGCNWPERVLSDGVYYYVVMPDGEVRITEHPRPKSRMHHPELANGKEVIAAGTLTLLEARVRRIDNESGHYSPRGDSVDYAFIAFQHWGIPLDQKVKKITSWEVFNNY